MAFLRRKTAIGKYRFFKNHYSLYKKICNRFGFAANLDEDDVNYRLEEEVGYKMMT